MINTNPRATIALSSLREILVTMTAKIIKPANLTLDLAGRGLDAEGIIADAKLSKSLGRAIALFVDEIVLINNIGLMTNNL